MTFNAASVRLRLGLRSQQDAPAPAQGGRQNGAKVLKKTTKAVNPRIEPSPLRVSDKQLQAVTLEAVLEKRRLDQALNVKEFAVCVGLSYSTARAWFRLPGFPSFHGVVFWKDFVEWRTAHFRDVERCPRQSAQGSPVVDSNNLPSKAARLLKDR